MGEWWRSPFQDDWTLAELVSRSAELNAQRPALLAGDGVIYTHGDIANYASKLTGNILTTSSPGTVVATLTTLDLPCFASVQAVVTSGCILAPLDAEAPDDRNQRNLQHVGARILITNQERREQAYRLAGTDCRIIVFEDAIGANGIAEHRPAPTDIVAYIFTSGRSGAAKAVIRSQRDYAHAVYCFSKNLYRYTANDRMLIPGSPGHVGSLNDVLSCLAGGFMAVPVDTSHISLQGLLELIKNCQINILQLPPSLLRAITPILQQNMDRLCLRIVVTSGEALLRRDVRCFFDAFPTGIELWQNYGSTETGPICASQYSGEDAHGKDPLPLRSLHDHCAVEILDSEGLDVPTGTQGQIRVCSPYLARGYLDADEVDTRRFTTVNGNAAFLAGDLGMYSDAGELYVAGRSDRQFSQHGRRFEASEVEAAALTHPGVQEAILVPVEADGSTSFVLAVSAAPGQTIDFGELRTTMSMVVAKAILPQRMVALESVPRTAGGKVDYRAVQLLVAPSLQTPNGTGGPPKGSMENWIADCWQEVLKISRPGRDEPFESLGGTSLHTIELSWILESRFGLRFHPELLVEASTIAKQAQQGIEHKHELHNPLITLRDDRKGPYVLMLPGIGGHAWVFAELCRQLSTQATYVAVNYAAMFRAMGAGRSREHIAEYLADTLIKEGRGRPIIAIGYSIGGVAAADLKVTLRAMGQPLTGCVLVDPARLAKNRSRSSLRAEVKRMRDFFAGRNRDKSTSVRLNSFEDELMATSQQLREAYKNAEPIESSSDSTVICSEETMKSDFDDPIRASVRAHDGVVVPCKHLDLLRIPHVTQTAQLVDAVIERDGQA
ncbi:alpha/beta fold hydrolase [Aeoliella sp.]|uniref:alpha/beta fold hydrolase n=1 Tax=Aeoliella sp. TaxID=2795800 RepID=UPI003CCB872B